MTKVDSVSPIIRPIITPILRVLRIEVPFGIRLQSLYACIHELEDHEKIKSEQTIDSLGSSLSISFDTRTLSENNGFQIYGFQEGVDEPVVGLIGNSTHLNSVTTLRLGRADEAGDFPEAS